jgi:hypothetical protein
MGASTAHFVGDMFKRNWPDYRVLLAAVRALGSPPLSIVLRKN